MTGSKKRLRWSIDMRADDCYGFGEMFESDGEVLRVRSSTTCRPQKRKNCLWNMARLVNPGGDLSVTGIDLDIRAKVARDLVWRPVLELIEEIHEGDPTLRQDWPCDWWGLEPLGKDRPRLANALCNCFLAERG